MAFVPPTISGYNINAPSDDGSVTPNNRGSWATIKTKLADPLYNWTDDLIDAIQAMETEVYAAIAANTSLISALPVPVTGDYRLTSDNTAPATWAIMNDGTLGDASSSGTMRANADCEDLFLLWYEKYPDATVSGGRGASAAADWAAHKTIQAPIILGRAVGIAGAGSGLTSRAMGAAVGAETHTLSAAEMQHYHGIPQSNRAQGPAGGVVTPDGNTSGVTLNSPSAHNNMQPTGFAFNLIVKL